METLLQFLLPLFSSFLVVLISISFYRLKKTAASNGNRCTAPPPEAGGAWPIIGHLHIFGSQQLTHKTLGAMADQYGPVFTIRLGSREILVLSSSEMARECFTTHDRVFATRPSISASKILGYDFAMFGFAPYGSYWREMRKIATIELLSNHRLEMLKHIRASEVKISIRELYEMWISEKKTDGSVFVDLKRWFGDLTLNLAVRLVGGKRYFGASADAKEGEARTCQKVIRDFAYLFGVFVLSDAIPFFSWLDWKGHKKAMKRTAKELDSLIGGWLQEHKEKRLLGGEGKVDQDFMDVLLSVLENVNFSGFDAETVNKATCLVSTIPIELIKLFPNLSLNNLNVIINL